MSMHCIRHKTRKYHATSILFSLTVLRCCLQHIILLYWYIIPHWKSTSDFFMTPKTSFQLTSKLLSLIFQQIIKRSKKTDGITSMDDDIFIMYNYVFALINQKDIIRKLLQFYTLISRNVLQWASGTFHYLFCTAYQSLKYSLHHVTTVFRWELKNERKDHT